MKKTNQYLLAVIFALAFSLNPAMAEFRVCNDTQNLVVVALGYQDKNSWQTSGWWQVLPMSCSSIIKHNLTSRYYYLHAEDAKNEARWEGSIYLCVADKKFNIKGINNCYVRGYQKASFCEIDTGSNSSWTVHLKN